MTKSNTQQREYVAVQVQIVGNVTDWRHSYTPITNRYGSRDKAIRAGIRAVDHDDFLIAVLEGQRLVGTAWQHDDRPEEDDERHEMADQCGWAS